MAGASHGEATFCFDLLPLRQLLEDGAHHLLVVKSQ